MITLITCTGDRPECFRLLCRWMEHQTYQGHAQWIIVDDGKVPIPHPPLRFFGVPRWEVHYIRNEPSNNGAVSFCINLLSAFEHIQGDKVLFIEDDDYYKPNHIEHLSNTLDNNVISGQGTMVYYFMKRRLLISRYNLIAPMACTGVRWSKMQGIVTGICHYGISAKKSGVDGYIWQHTLGMKERLLYNDVTCIGLKGMPGRMNLTGKAWWNSPNTQITKDPNGMHLRALMGKDYQHYEKYWG